MMTKSSGIQQTFHTPGLGENLTMDKHGRVFRQTEEGREQIAFRSQDGVWHLVYAIPINSQQIAEALEDRFRGV